MKKREIENKLRNASNSFVPDVYRKILQRKDEIIYEESPFAGKAKIKSRLRKNPRKAIMAFAAILVVALGIGMFFGIMNQDNEVVYMEINPAMEITTNRFDRVKRVTYLNEDAEEMFFNENIKGQKIDKALERFVDLSYDNGYMRDDNTMYIVAEAKNNQEKAEQTAQRLRQQAIARTAQKNIATTIVAERVTEEQRNQAREQHIPMAKVALINQIIRFDSSYTRDELNSKSMTELQNIRKRQQEEEKEENRPEAPNSGNTNPSNGKENSGNQNDLGNGNNNTGNSSINHGNGNSGNNR